MGRLRKSAHVSYDALHGRSLYQHGCYHHNRVAKMGTSGGVLWKGTASQPWSCTRVTTLCKDATNLTMDWQLHLLRSLLQMASLDKIFPVLWPTWSGDQNWNTCGDRHGLRFNAKLTANYSQVSDLLLWRYPGSYIMQCCSQQCIHKESDLVSGARR